MNVIWVGAQLLGGVKICDNVNIFHILVVILRNFIEVTFRMSSETVYPLPGDFAVMSLEGAIISVSVFRVDKKVMSV